MVKPTPLGALQARIVAPNAGPATPLDDAARGGPVLVLLHGFGAPGDDLVPLWKVLGAPSDTRFVFPAAPLDLGPLYMGGRAWWPIDFEERLMRRMRGDHGEDDVPPGLTDARSKVLTLLDEVERTLRPSRLVLGGFSQGAMLSLDVALHGTHHLDGLVLLSTTQLAREVWEPRYASLTKVPVFMSHGREDELLPFFVTERLRDRMRAASVDVEWVEFHGGHGIPPEVIGPLQAFLQRTLSA